MLPSASVLLLAKRQIPLMVLHASVSRQSLTCLVSLGNLLELKIKLGELESGYIA